MRPVMFGEQRDAAWDVVGCEVFGGCSTMRLWLTADYATLTLRQPPACGHLQFCVFITLNLFKSNPGLHSSVSFSAWAK